MIPGISEERKFGAALVLISMVLLMNATSVLFRMWLRNKKKW
jgi:ABC-type phosphate transport system permease subunit